MNKPLQTGLIDSMIHAQLAAENAPVTAAQFAEYRRMVDFAFGHLQQQVISMDVTCGLLVERLGVNPDGTPWTQEQRKEFGEEVRRRVVEIAEGMARQARDARDAEEKKKVQLV